jgi:anti-sigma regulatory factor (Ser/Thr protein kinase)
MTISDDSAPFDPLSLDTPDTTLDLDSRGIGGLGIHLIRTMMDDVAYRHSNGQNHLTMTKQLVHDTQGTA